jgi:hypothetical protein
MHGAETGVIAADGTDGVDRLAGKVVGAHRRPPL